MFNLSGILIFFIVDDQNKVLDLCRMSQGKVRKIQL